MIERTVSKSITDDFKKEKIILLMGARQVGKTTLAHELAKGRQRVLHLNCDNYDDRADLEHQTSTELAALLAGYDFVLIDEAQRVPDIGMTIKMIGDLKLSVPTVVTGSSSLELLEDIKEPATGRHIDYELFPLSLPELIAHNGRREEHRLLEQRLIFGFYPEVVTDLSDAKRTLMTLANDYLYKDLLAYKGVKRPEVLHKLLVALALQIGSEVSYNELSGLLGIDKATVESYIGLLEKCYVIFRIDSFSRNLRNEIKKGKKIYFVDNGIRNAVLANFAPLNLRNDVGALWENLLVSERKKRNAYARNYARLYFWRTHSQREIDLIEEQDGRLQAFEFKWNAKTKATLPANFSEAYPDTPFTVVSPDNYTQFVTG